MTYYNMGDSPSGVGLPGQIAGTGITPDSTIAVGSYNVVGVSPTLINLQPVSTPSTITSASSAAPIINATQKTTTNGLFAGISIGTLLLIMLMMRRRRR